LDRPTLGRGWWSALLVIATLVSSRGLAQNAPAVPAPAEPAPASAPPSAADPAPVDPASAPADPAAAPGQPADPAAAPAADGGEGAKPPAKLEPLWKESRDLRPDAKRPPWPVTTEEKEPKEQPSADVSFHLGTGFMRGGLGGLMEAQLAPITMELQALRIQDARLLLGGALRVELQDAKAVAGIARIALRYPFGSLELRPGAGIPFYFAPRTMLGLEGGLGARLPLSDDLGLVAQLSASAFMIGNDVPSGSTVIFIHLMVGVDLML
jgi:hypothetical protein